MRNLQSEKMDNIAEVMLLVILCASIHCGGCVLVLVLFNDHCISYLYVMLLLKKVQLEQSEEFEGNAGSEPRQLRQ